MRERRPTPAPVIRTPIVKIVQILDLRTAIELQKEEKMTDNVMNILMEDRQFREFVSTRMREVASAIAQRG
jgi:hypothetical protein